MPASSSFAFAAVELLGRHRDRHVLQRADRLLVRLVLVAGEVEEAEQVAVAEVEEEVARAGVVAVLDQLDEREAEEVLVEADRLLDVLADERGVVDAARGRRRPVARRAQVASSRSSSRRARMAASSSPGGLWHGRA